MVNLYILLLAVGIPACKKSGNSGGNQPSPGDQPAVRVSDVTQGRQTQATAFRFFVDLNNISQKPVSVNYATLDGTAKAGTDYTASSGTLTIAAGQTEAPDETRILKIDSATGMKNLRTKRISL